MRVYPVFVSHGGCPFRCIYCDQKAVTRSDHKGNDNGPIREKLARMAAHSLETGLSGEVAFYGGTFTLLARERLESLLETATKWVNLGAFTGIRFSTRPDALSDSVIELLKRYPVSTIELGIQSFSDEVLAATGRGYSKDDAWGGAARVRDGGWRLGLQLMMGLPADSRERFLASVDAAIEASPDLVRLYPTLVLKGTELERWYRRGHYQPLDLARTVRWATEAYSRFKEAGIALARLGLQEDRQLSAAGTVVAGPHHPAFGYLVKANWWRRRIEADLSQRCVRGGRFILRVPAVQVSEAIGHRKQNLSAIKARWNLEDLKVVKDVSLPIDTYELLEEA